MGVMTILKRHRTEDVALCFCYFFQMVNDPRDSRLAQSIENRFTKESYSFRITCECWNRNMK